jgi:hypothetical protein
MPTFKARTSDGFAAEPLQSIPYGFCRNGTVQKELGGYQRQKYDPAFVDKPLSAALLKNW